MSKCDICGKESGEYTLCPECFQELQQGNLEKCNNCGRWYAKGKICSCVRTVEKQSNNIQPTPQYEEQEGNSRIGCFIASVIVILCVAALIGLVIHVIKNSPEYGSGETSIITQVTKEKPTITAQQSNLGTTINLQIKANDNYEEVIVQVLIYDENKNIISKQYLTQTNLTKGNTYIVSYNLTWSEITKGHSYTYELYKYK